MNRVSHVWEKKKWCIFCRKGRVPRQLFWKFHSSSTYMTSSQHSNGQVTITVTCRVANLTSCSEVMSEGETVAKNRIEFQWGSKLQGTSSEALLSTRITESILAVILVTSRYENQFLPFRFPVNTAVSVKFDSRKLR